MQRRKANSEADVSSESESEEAESKKSRKVLIEELTSELSMEPKEVNRSLNGARLKVFEKDQTVVTLKGTNLYKQSKFAAPANPQHKPKVTSSALNVVQKLSGSESK